MLFNDNRRFNSYVGHLRSTYGSRVQKIVVDAGFTCPNRDGTKGLGGCTYCDNDAFHPSYSTPQKPIIQQLNEGIEFHRGRYRNVQHYLAYFQPYSNTYDSVDRLKVLYNQALSHPLVCGLVIGTRPDCVDDQILDLLTEIAKEKIVIIEYGVESVYDKTLLRINRGHTVECTKEAIKKSAGRGIEVGAHFILGLPGESKEEMMGYAQFINELPIDSIKFHQLQIVKGTQMEREFLQERGDFIEWGLAEYVDFFIDLLETLRPNVMIERFAGEVPPRFLSYAPWGAFRNPDMVRMLEKRLEERETFQSRLYKG